MAALSGARCLIVVGILLLAGCETHRDDDTSRESSPYANSETRPHKYADLLPHRTRELDLSDVDPCADVLTEQQLWDLDYDLGLLRPPRPSRSNIHGGPECTFASNGGAGAGVTNRNVSSQVGISTTEGASAWLTDPAREPRERPEVVNVQGFSALVLPNPKFPDDCLVVVDTAEGQYLGVSSGESSGSADDPAPYCQEAERVAGFAIQTVEGRR